MGDCCPCCGDAEHRTETDPADRWREGDAVVDAPLPADLQTAFGEFLDRDRVETLRDVAAAVRESTDEDAVTVDGLCVAEDPTGHSGTVDDDTDHFECFFDAVLLAVLRDEEVEIRTESPDGTVIEATADPSGEVESTPPDAVASFGVDPAAADAHEIDAAGAGDGAVPPTEAGCPYVRAFPDRTAYEAWAETTAAPTVGFPLADGAELARLLTDAQNSPD